MAAENANAGIPRGAVSHGARHYVTINGVRVGYCAGFSMQQNVDVRPVDVLDNLLTEEHVVVGVTYSGSIEMLLIIGRSLIQAGVQTPIDQLLGGPIRNFAIVDRVTGKVIHALRVITFSGKSSDIRKGTLTTQRLNFMAIEAVDENGVIDV